MSETVIDSVEIAASGTETGTFSCHGPSDEVAFIVSGDGNSSDLTFELIEVAFETNDTDTVSHQNPTSKSNVDATSDSNNQIAFRLSNMRGFRQGNIEVTNNAASATTITLEQSNYSTGFQN